MDDKQPTPERLDSPWRTDTPWIPLEHEDRSCDYHGPYRASLYKAVTPKGWEEKQSRNTLHEEVLDPFIRDFWSSCPKCDDLKHAEQMAHYKETIDGHEMRQLLAEQRAAQAGIDKRFALADPYSMKQFHPKMRPILHEIRDYCHNFDMVRQQGRCIIMGGVPGTGKTHALCAIVNYVLRKGSEARYTTMESMLELVKNTYHEGSSVTERQAVEAFTKVDLLAIDEIGRAMMTEHTKKTFQHIIDTRYRACRPTAIATNLDRRGFESVVGEAMASRLREAGGKFLTFGWESLREREDLVE